MKQITGCLIGTALLAVVLLVNPGISAAADGGEDPCVRPAIFGDIEVSSHDTWILGTEGPDSIEGTEGCDVILGNGGKDVIHGYEDNDSLSGGRGRDRIIGGKGDDLIYGGPGKDKLFGNRGDDALIGGYGDDYIEGNQGEDGLYGDWGQDYLIGGKGDDWLVGGDGDDRLQGGPGADAFQFESGDGEDTILDFEDGVDHLDIFLDGLASFNQMSAVRDITYGDNGEVILPVIGAYFSAGGETGVSLNLTQYGGGRILILDLDLNALDASDFNFTSN